MKNLLSIIVAVVMLWMPNVADAQTARSKNTWKPYGFVQYQLGAGTTFTNISACKLLQPTMTFGVGYMPIPELGIRYNINGFWSEGGFKDIDEKYLYKYVTNDFDLLFNMTNIFSKNKMRPLNLYLVAGIGVDYAWDNDIANLPLEKVTDNISNKWGNGLDQTDFWGTNFRLGVLADYSINSRWNFGVEVDFNPITDDFNSKFGAGKSRDWMMTTQLSLAYKFYKKGDKPKDEVVVRPTRVEKPVEKKPVVVKTKIRLDDKSLDGKGNYGVAIYDPNQSKSSKNMLDNMAKQIRTECAPYIEEGGKVDVIFSGCADAIPVLGIKYNGEDVHDLPVNIDGIPVAMTLTKAGGINTNEQLALARALRAKEYIYSIVPGLNTMKTTHYYNVKAANERGAEFRTVDVEFIFYGK